MKRSRLRPVSKKTKTQRWPRLKALRQQALQRAGGRCEAVSLGGCWGPLDAHHIRRRSAGGVDDLDNLCILCRAHHQQTEAAYRHGRLVIGPNGVAIITKENKWATTENTSERR